jgi:hypothetical protein
VQVDVDKAVAFSGSGDLEWVDPFVGFRIRHEMGTSKELGLEADFGGFGVGSDFSWQVVGTYGLTRCLWARRYTPCSATVHYRSISARTASLGRMASTWCSTGRLWELPSAGKFAKVEFASD